ncbi:unnamed protein product [Dicrocoelium dendriticum]|nr:unnamed protein product [Dicrocoelium dendriticum]
MTVVFILILHLSPNRCNGGCTTRSIQHDRRPRSRSRDRHRDLYAWERKHATHRDDGYYDRENGHRDRDELYRRDRGDLDLEREDRSRRDRERRRRHDRHRSNSLPRSRSHSPRAPALPVPEPEVTKTLDDSGEPLTEEQQEMMRLFGFCGFDSTKGKHVIGNSIYVANISKQRKYRQYMNRRGGFNRPLDRVA